MPYKNQKLKLKLPREKDARVKLSLEDRAEIKKLYGTISQRKLAKMFGVSRSLVRWYGDPDKYKENLKRREERGGSMIYYDKDKHTKGVKETRRKRQALYLKGELIKEE